MPRRASGKQHRAVNAHVGARLRQLRLTLGLSQTEVGGKLGVSYQQVQKYERGASALAADRLAQVAGVLNVPISYFFEGLSNATTSHPSGDTSLRPEEVRVLKELRRLPTTVRNAMQQLMVSTNGSLAEEGAKGGDAVHKEEGARTSVGRAKS